MKKAIVRMGSGAEHTLFGPAADAVLQMLGGSGGTFAHTDEFGVVHILVQGHIESATLIEPPADPDAKILAEDPIP